MQSKDSLIAKCTSFRLSISFTKWDATVYTHAIISQKQSGNDPSHLSKNFQLAAAIGHENAPASVHRKYTFCDVVLLNVCAQLSLLYQLQCIQYGFIQITANAEHPPSHLCDGLMDCQNGRRAFKRELQYTFHGYPYTFSRIPLSQWLSHGLIRFLLVLFFSSCVVLRTPMDAFSTLTLKLLK